MKMTDHLGVREGICEFRPGGESTLVEIVALITEAVAYCRHQGISKLLISANDLRGVSIPTLVDRFLMMEEWAQAARGMLVAAIVAHSEYIHPEKFGVKVAADLGLVVDVFTSEPEALKWLSTYRPPD
jgi:uncharacterized protein (DUF2384 family)